MNLITTAFQSYDSLFLPFSLINNTLNFFLPRFLCFPKISDFHLCPRSCFSFISSSEFLLTHFVAACFVHPPHPGSCSCSCSSCSAMLLLTVLFLLSASLFCSPSCSCSSCSEFSDSLLSSEFSEFSEFSCEFLL